MKIKLNGKLVEVPDNSTISDILEIEEIIEPIAVEVFVNGEKIDYEKYDSYKLNENDEVEYLYLFASG